MMKKILISEIPEEMQGKRGWFLELNGEVIPVVRQLRLVNQRYGELLYGLSPGGYDTWAFHENGGGGSIIIPYALIGGKLYVGLVNESRPNQNQEESVWNTPRGFLEGRDHFQAAKEELQEETGYRSMDPELLLGEAMNPNSAFFITLSEKDEGVRAFALEIKAHELIQGADGWTFNPEVLKPVSKQAEKIFKCRFLPWREAVKFGDMMTLSVISRLLAKLL